MMPVTISSYHRAYFSVKVYVGIFGSFTFEWYDSNYRLYKVDHFDGTVIKDGFFSLEAAESWCREMEYTLEDEEGTNA